MSFKLEKLQDQPVLLLTLFSTYDLAKDFPNSYKEVYQFLETTNESVYYVMDLSETEIDMNLVLDGIKQTSVNERGTFRHPMTRGVLFVTSDPIAQAVAGGLSDEAFGSINAHVFGSLDDALDYVEQQG